MSDRTIDKTCHGFAIRLPDEPATCEPRLLTLAEMLDHHAEANLLDSNHARRHRKAIVEALVSELARRTAMWTVEVNTDHPPPFIYEVSNGEDVFLAKTAHSAQRLCALLNRIR